MSIAGVFFVNQTPTAEDFGALFDGIVEDGVLKGCALSTSGAVLTVAAGYFIAAGRLMKISAAEQITTTVTSGYARVLVQIDKSGASTGQNFTQASFVVQYAATVSAFPALTKNDVNGSGTVYQMVLCVLALGSSGVSSIYKNITPAAPVLAATPIILTEGVHYGTSLPAAGTVGRIFFKRVT